MTRPHQEGRRHGGPRQNDHQRGGRHGGGQSAGGGHGAGADPEPAYMSAPYRFVPISAWVHSPPWADQVSIDRPFEDGVSGWLEVTITAESPLMIGGERHKKKGKPTHVHFYKTPDGKYAIPGSSWRGMIRSVLEIASFGRAAFIEDVRDGLRDLSPSMANKIYRKRMAKVEAGWLLPQDPKTGEVRVQPCSWAKVRLTELGNPGRWNDVLPVGGRYAAFGAESLERTLYVDNKSPAEAFAQYAPGRSERRGTLVFTAKTARGDFNEKNKKKREHFFFQDDECPATPQPLSKAWGEFLNLNTWDVGKENVGGDERRPGWSYWSVRHELGEKVPVFFICNETGIDALGTASMFRVLHELSKLQVLDNTHPRHRNQALRDFPSLMFGLAGGEKTSDEKAVGEDKATAEARGPRKGRVSFEMALIQREPSTLTPVGPVVLATPHGGFFPATVAQPTVGGKLDGSYASFTTGTGAEERSFPELAGRKRYPSRSGLLDPLPNVGSDDMRSVLHPLPKGSEFKGRVRFHNLKPEELGALIWCIRLWADEWDEEPEPKLRHRLGMGKPLGFGDVTLEITDARIEYNRLKGGERQVLAREVAVTAARASSNIFTKHMTEAFDAAKEEFNAATDAKPQSTWKTSEQIETLLAFSDPKFANVEFLKYMRMNLNSNPRVNDFKKAKDLGLVLPPNPRRSADKAGDKHGRETDREVFPRNRPSCRRG